MKISICVPQFNRIQYLLKSLALIEQQTYPDIEICISDDCSTDETETLIKELIPNYKFPLIYQRFSVNQGFDRNYRKCIEMASGEYALVIGNDDSINGNDSIAQLVNFLKNNNFPDIGFCNLLEERTGNTVIERALDTKVLGTGTDVAMKYYSCFSFVGGLIYKKSTFLNYNTDRYDGSIYAQMYLGVLMVASGASIFSIKEPMVIKDLLLDGKFRNSYRDRIAKKWADFKVVDGGLPSVINVLISALRDSEKLTQKYILHIFKRIYAVTYTHWLLDYRENGAYPTSVGLMLGMSPRKNKNFHLLSFTNKIYIYLVYFVSTIIGLFTPVFIFRSLKNRIYKFLKQ